LGLRPQQAWLGHLQTFTGFAINRAAKEFNGLQGRGRFSNIAGTASKPDHGLYRVELPINKPKKVKHRVCQPRAAVWKTCGKSTCSAGLVADLALRLHTTGSSAGPVFLVRSRGSIAVCFAACDKNAARGAQGDCKIRPQYTILICIAM